MIRIEHITKRYGEKSALEDVNFSLTKGEFVGLLGVNGAGKSTLMKILCGILKADSGKVFFDNQQLSIDSLHLKKRIGYLSEDNPLYEDMYVKEYLVYVADIYKAERSRVDLLIDQTGLQKEYRKKIKELSRGNRQRVGVAQALIHDPEFLILDEATSGLDPNQRESLNNLLIELSANKVILYSTHILSEVEEFCSRFIILDKGNLIADHKVSEIESIKDIFHKLTNENNS